MARAMPTLRIDNETLSIYSMELLARLNETIDAIEAAYREYQFNDGRTAALRLCLERLLRLVCRSGEDGNFRQRRGAEEICAGSHGFCSFRDLAIAASLHAAHHRGALVTAGSRRSLDSICRAAGKDPLEMIVRRHHGKRAACFSHLQYNPGRTKSASGIQTSIEQEDTLHFTHD